MYVRALVVSLMALLLGACGGSGGSPTSPSPTPIGTNPQPVSDYFASGMMDPTPLPVGSPQYLCGKPPSTEGYIEFGASVQSGSGKMQIFLVTKENSQRAGCTADKEVCSSAIYVMDFDDTFGNQRWNVAPGDYCFGLRNRTTNSQRVSVYGTFWHY